MPVDYAFSLMARLYPDVDAYKVLKTTEGLASMPALMTFIFGLLCFIMQLSLLKIGLAVFIFSVMGYIDALFLLNIVPGLYRLATFYSYISGFGIMLVILSIIGFLRVGFLGVLVFLGSIIVSRIVIEIIDSIHSNKVHKNTGIVVTGSEMNFLNAYRFEAKKLKRTTSIDVSEDEKMSDKWILVLEDLQKKWPEVVRRFTRD